MRNLVRTVLPTVEPVSLQEAKDFLIQFTDPSCDGIITVAAIAPSVYTPGNVESTAVDVLNKTASVTINVGVVAATSSVDVTVLESNDGSAWTLVYSFTTLTAANDLAAYTYNYTGLMRYIKVSVDVATDTAGFSAEINTVTGDTSEDELIENLIVMAREYCEAFQGRAYITQTWEMSLPYFPSCVLEIPKGNLQTIDSIKYTDADGLETTLDPALYVVSTRGILGRVANAYGTVYPSFVPYPLDAVVITFTCGYGDTALDVPERVKYAMKVLITHWYDNRALLVNSNMKNEVPKSVNTLLMQERIVTL